VKFENRETAMARIFFVLIIFFLVGGVEAAKKNCAPKKLFNAVYKCIPPGIDNYCSNGRLASTFRLGEKYGRIDAQQDYQRKEHITIIVNEPDVWIIEKNSKTAKHVVDQGPTYIYRQPIFSNTSIKSDFIRTIELGCETKSLIEAGAKKITIEDKTIGKLDALQYLEGSEELILYLSNGTPIQLEYYRNNKRLGGLKYLVYQENLSFKKGLFKLPNDIKIISEAPSSVIILPRKK